MSAKPFLDTNILVYAFTKDDPRSDAADSLLKAGGIISVQVLNEFVNVSRRKLRHDWAEIERQRAVLFKLLDPPIALTLTHHNLAMTLARRYNFSVYDALIIAAARDTGCSLVYSEDMQHGQSIDGVTIRNPFV